MSKLVKCRNKHCLHDHEPIMQDEAIRVGNAYYHKDCYEVVCNCKEAIDLFAKKINPDVSFAVLVKVINNLVYNQKIDSGFLVFVVKYSIENGINLRYPQGLYRLSQNPKIISEYKNKQNSIAMKMFRDMKMEKESGDSFHHNPVKVTSFEDILR